MSVGRRRTALQQGIAYLSRREYSRQELSRRLIDCGYETSEVGTALDRLVAEGWQDDTRFAQALVRMRAGSGYGPLRIRHELSKHGLGDRMADQILDPYGPRWTDIATEWIVRRYGGGAEFAADHAMRRKAGDFLLRRGFEVGVMHNALRAAAETEIA